MPDIVIWSERPAATPAQSVEVSTAAGLIAAAANPLVARITVLASLTGLSCVRLLPGQALAGHDVSIELRFAPGQDGVQLSTDNQVECLEVSTDPDRTAVFNDTGVDGLGRLVLSGLRITGVVRLLARDRVRSGHVEAHDINTVAADARGYDTRPKGYGVEVIPDAFTLWN